MKHLEHRDVSKQPPLQVKIINVATYLAKKVKTQASTAIAAAISEVLRYMRKCMMFSLESSTPESDRCEWNESLYSALDDFLVQLINKASVYFSYS